MEKENILKISKTELEKRMAEVSADMTIEMLETTKDPESAFFITASNAMFSARLLRDLFGDDDGEDE